MITVHTEPIRHGAQPGHDVNEPQVRYDVQNLSPPPFLETGYPQGLGAPNLMQPSPPSSAPAFGEETTVSDIRVQAETPPPSTRNTWEARLLVLSGEHTGDQVTLGGECVIGRGHHVDLRLLDAQVSRRHARVRRKGADYLLEDLGSRNGTLVNGERIQGPQVLTFGDRIQLGTRVVLLFCRHDPAEEEHNHRQRLEALGRLGAGLAHDFNNLLGAMQSTLDFLSSLPDEQRLGTPEVRESLRDMSTAARRAAELTQRVLGFARRRPAEMNRMDLAELADEVVRLCRRTFPRSIRIYLRAERGLCVQGDRAQLHQVLMNLCLNARDAIQSEGSLRITARRASPKERSRLLTCPDAPDGSGAALIVEDDGVGMDEETLRHAFDPFFSTKPGHVGSGLGLASAYQTIKHHGGEVLIESQPGRGTRICLLFPACSRGEDEGRRNEQCTTDRIAVPHMRTTTADSNMRRRLILLVDDEDVVRRSTARLLRRAGYDVTLARDGREAIAILRHAERPPDVVLMDLDMPVMSGEEAFQRIRKLHHDLPVVFISGYWDMERERTLLTRGAAGFLHKPFDSATLRSTLVDLFTTAGHG